MLGTSQCVSVVVKLHTMTLTAWSAQLDCMGPITYGKFSHEDNLGGA
jgi:hypothetical protein